MNLLRAATTVGGYTMVSRLLGFARDILIAFALGAGPVADAFFVAFKLPNFFRRLFAEGAFNAGFVPLFSALLQQEGPGAARAFAEQALSVLLWTLLALVAAMQIAMPWLMYGLAPGFADDPAKFDLTVALTRLTFPYLLFISLVSLMGGVLNAMGRFAAVAATPILLNLCMIAGLLLLAGYTETPGHALAWGVAIAGMVQFVWLIVAARHAGMSLRLPVPRLTPRVKELLRLMLPGVIGAGVVQINLVADVILASFLPEGSVTFLYFADRVNQLPLGVVGVAVGTALLPLMSRQVAAGEDGAAGHSQNRAIELSLLLAIPAAVALVALAEPIMTVLFQHGAFGAPASAATAAALMAYAVGLPAYVLVKVLTPGYFARKDTVSPMRIAALCVAINLVLNLILMWPLQHAGLALATAIAAWVNTILLARGLGRRGLLRLDQRTRKRLPRIVAASAVMGLGLWIAMRALDESLAGTRMEQIVGLIVLIAGGLLAYGIAAQIAGAARYSDFRALLRGRPSEGGVDRGEPAGP